MNKIRKYLGFGVSALLIGTLLFVTIRAQDVRDWLILRDYQPSQRIEQIAESTTMTAEGKKLFYVHDPRIESQSEFNRDCTTLEESLVLGCYNGVHIYIFDVSDTRLSGVHEVTAAHEMLHAAYDRLSSKERQRVDDMTAKQLQKLSNDRIQEVVKSYRSRDPAVVPNELHSIFGSELKDLDPELEAYYSQYFSNRSLIVGFSESYEQVFTSIHSQVERYDSQLLLLKAQIDQNELDLEQRAESISAQKVNLNQLAESGQASKYNALVPGYNEQIEQYNADVEAYKLRIQEYNDTVKTRNDLTLEQNSLVKSLDSRATEL